MVKAKKYLGQHFLTDTNLAKKIVISLKNIDKFPVIEVGPGMGVLSQYLKETCESLYLVEIDIESIAYLKQNFSKNDFIIIESDFLKVKLTEIIPNSEFCIIGNFPYNISSQIFFKLLENKAYVPELVGMVQKEMAERIASVHGNKTYGILSVMLQLFYKVEYLFTVNETVFRPPPNVKSAVIRLVRYRDKIPGLNEDLLFKLVKSAFNYRRKTLRNSLKSQVNDQNILAEQVFNLRPEQLSPEDFVALTMLIQNAQGFNIEI